MKKKVLYVKDQKAIINFSQKVDLELQLSLLRLTNGVEFAENGASRIGVSEHGEFMNPHPEENEKKPEFIITCLIRRNKESVTYNFQIH